MSNPLTVETRFMRTSEVLSTTGIKSRSTLYALEAAGKFPARVFITDKAVGFIEKEIQDWMEQRIAARPAPMVMSAAPPRVRRSQATPTATPSPTTATPPTPRRRGPARPRAARPVIG